MISEERREEREALVQRLKELYQEIDEHERRIKETEARLPLEEQYRLALKRALPYADEILAIQHHYHNLIDQRPHINSPIL